jgi:hypothetical protein
MRIVSAPFGELATARAARGDDAADVDDALANGLAAGACGGARAGGDVEDEGRERTKKRVTVDYIIFCLLEFHGVRKEREKERAKREKRNTVL